jgi:hypothetical protein
MKPAVREAEPVEEKPIQDPYVARLEEELKKRN